MQKRCLFLFTVLVSSLQNVYAQHIFMRKISPENGISAHEIYNIFQDSRHFIWFATDAGVWRFDGKEYKSFTTANGLTDNVVFGFFEDSKKRLWLNSYNNKISYIENETVFTIPCSSWLFHHRQKDLIGNICLDRADTLYISYWNEACIFKIAPPYSEKDIQRIPAPIHSLAFLYETNEGNILAGSPTLKEVNITGITVFNGRKQSVLRFRQAPLPNPRINAFLQKDGSYLVGISNILLRYAHGTLTELHAFDHVILYATLDHQKNLWVATIDGGLLVFNASDSAFSHPQVYFKNDFANCVVQDYEGSYWVATLKNGLYYLPFYDLKLLNENAGLADNITFSWHDPQSGKLFCFDNNGIMYILHNDTIEQKINITFDPRQKNNITGMYPLGREKILFLGRHCFLFDVKSKSCEPFRFSDPIYSKLLPGGSNACALNDSLFLCSHASLFGVQPDKKLLLYYASLDFKVNDICGTGKNNILLASERGLFRFDLLEKKVYPVPGFPDESSVLACKPIPGTENIAVILKGGGVYLLDRQLNKIVMKKNDLGGVSVRNAYVDDEGIIWLSTNRGIFKMDKNLQVSVIDKAHGLPTDLVYQVCCNNSTAFVSSESGLITFPRNKSFIVNTAPDLYITSVRVNGHTMANDSLDELRYDQNFIKINWLGLNFRSGSDLSCWYKMNGVDKDWQVTGTNTIEYTTLPPGQYDFEAYVLNNDHVKSASSIRLHFIIHPPFWKTWWFTTLLSVTLIFLLLLLQKNRERRIEKREREKAELTRKTVQAEMQALRSQMNPHFIFNSINSIQHYILTNDPLSANKYLTRFSKLMRNILEQSRKDRIPLSNELETLGLFIEMEALRFEDRFDYEIRVEKNIDAERTFVPPLIIQPFAENAIWHGLLLKEGDKKLLIHVTRENNILQIEIDDNGIGRQQASKYRNETLKKESLGIKITNERLDLIENVLKIKASVQVIDKSGTGGEPNGTKVILIIPLN